MKLFPSLTALVLLTPLISQGAPLITDNNLLTGPGIVTTEAASSLFPFGGNSPSNVTDGLANVDFAFAPGDTNQRLSITGFNSSITSILVWSAPDLAPATLTIYSSTTSTNSLLTSDYSTILVSVSTSPNSNPPPALTTPLGYANLIFTGDPLNGPSGYYLFNISAPAGTQSLLFDFGSLNGGTAGSTSLGGNGGFQTGAVRISEIQAYSVIPEPSVGAMMVGGLGMLLLIQRKRRAAQA